MKEMTGSNYYCPKPADVKNASQGANGASRGGTKRDFMATTNGNTFPRPAMQNNASQGQTDGHNMGAPAQTRGYPNASPSGAAANAMSLKNGKAEYSPKPGDKKNASNGEGPNSKGGTSRSFPKKGGKGMSY